jgi:hypothetical protein
LRPPLQLRETTKPCFYSNKTCTEISQRLDKSGLGWLSENLRLWEEEGIKASPRAA